jgi:TolB protein
VSRLRWSPSRAVALALVALVWIGAGIGVYLYLGSNRSSVAAHAQRPEQAAPAAGPINHLPGTLYLVQGGTIYRLQGGTFTLMLSAAANATWTQPAVSPNGLSLVVVQRQYSFSDLYLVDATGHVQSQLTHDANRTVELNHWALYPRFGPDGSTLYFNYDPKDYYNNYNVVMAVWSMPVAGSPMRKWTEPNGYTGGDIQPVPIQSGGVVYTKYALDTATNKILGQLWLTKRAGSAGVPLTDPRDDCSQPALSPDGRRLAMICTGGTQLATIEIAAFDGTNLGPRMVVVSGQLAAQPTWSPDGNSLVYVAAQGISGHFQLWLQQIPQPPPPPTALPTPTHVRPATPPRGVRVASPTPTVVAPSPSPTTTPLPPPVRLTTNLDFDATSTIAWHA